MKFELSSATPPRKIPPRKIKLRYGPAFDGAVAKPSPLRDGRPSEGRAVSDFKGRYFGGEIVLWAVRWHCRYGISYRDLKQMTVERGMSVDHLDRGAGRTRGAGGSTRPA
jgi:hypothetical protein